MEVLPPWAYGTVVTPQTGIMHSHCIQKYNGQIEDNSTYS